MKIDMHLGMYISSKEAQRKREQEETKVCRTALLTGKRGGVAEHSRARAVASASQWGLGKKNKDAGHRDPTKKQNRMQPKRREDKRHPPPTLRVGPLKRP